MRDAPKTMGPLHKGTQHPLHRIIEDDEVWIPLRRLIEEELQRAADASGWLPGWGVILGWAAEVANRTLKDGEAAGALFYDRCIEVINS